MASIACNLLLGKNYIKVEMLPWQPELVVYCRAVSDIIMFHTHIFIEFISVFDTS
jgi:hypothetical protein